MQPDLPGALLREGLSVLAIVGGPLFAVLLLMGLSIGVVQASTQINDPAVGAIPRLVMAVAMVWLLGGWMAQRLSGFLASAITRMADRGF